MNITIAIQVLIQSVPSFSHSYTRSYIHRERDSRKEQEIEYVRIVSVMGRVCV